LVALRGREGGGGQAGRRRWGLRCGASRPRGAYVPMGAQKQGSGTGGSMTLRPAENIQKMAWLHSAPAEQTSGVQPQWCMDAVGLREYGSMRWGVIGDREQRNHCPSGRRPNRGMRARGTSRPLVDGHCGGGAGSPPSPPRRWPPRRRSPPQGPRRPRWSPGGHRPCTGVGDAVKGWRGTRGGPTPPPAIAPHRCSAGMMVGQGAGGGPGPPISRRALANR